MLETGQMSTERGREMKIFQSRWALCLTMLALISGPAWAVDRNDPSEDMPAILASLGADSVTVLDNQEAMAIRGQEYKYVLVKILGINALDFGPGVQWTWNPLDYRYGAWGGAGWSNGRESISNPVGLTPLHPTADLMDRMFRNHDLAYMFGNNELAADAALLCGLLSLAKYSHPYWGPIYLANPRDLTAKTVMVSGVSFIGSRLFFGWKAMPYTEYARREALTAMGIMVFSRALGIGLQ
jgi:hypothetical protein